MQRKYFRELWEIRFKKMLSLESQAASEYAELLAECRSLSKDHPVLTNLERLVTDEKKHAKLVEQLLKILDRQTD